MIRTEMLPEIRRMRFSTVYSGWQKGRIYTWVKNTLQSRGFVAKQAQTGKHRNFIVTMYDGTNEPDSIFFAEEEGTARISEGPGT